MWMFFKFLKREGVIIMKKTKMINKKGFTLVELVVVIAILAEEPENCVGILAGLNVKLSRSIRIAFMSIRVGRRRNRGPEDAGRSRF